MKFNFEDYEKLYPRETEVIDVTPQEEKMVDTPNTPEVEDKVVEPQEDVNDGNERDDKPDTE